jgi:hypothetical protein
LIFFYKIKGRFPQVSGIFFAFDPRKPAMKRIDSRIIKIQNEYLDLDKVLLKNQLKIKGLKN